MREMEENSEFRDPKFREYTNGEITVFWKPSLCVHATTCFVDLPKVFNPRKRPWVDMSGATSEQIIEIVKQCPTAALSFRKNSELAIPKKEPEPVVTTTAKTEIKVARNGPYLVKGSFTVTRPDGTKIENQNIVALCRCGKTHTSPLCDGTHKKAFFDIDGF